MSGAQPLTRGDVLWTPTADALEQSEPSRYLRWLRRERALDLAGYDELWRWSVDDLEGFWASIWDYFRDQGAGAVRTRARLTSTARRRVVPRRPVELRRAHARPGGRSRQRRDRRRLADARDGRAHVRRAARSGRAGPRRAPAARSRAGRPRRRLPPEHPRDARRVPRSGEPRRRLGDLPARVRRAQRPRTAWASSSRRCSSRSPATASASGSSTGAPRSRSSGSSCRRCVRSSTSRMPVGARTRWPGPMSWDALLAETAPLEFEQLPFAHPLYVLFSSGTTALPKAIVHGHGGILLEHLKNHALSWDLRPGDRLQWFTTTAWMMWNALVSTLLVRASIVMIDGNPAYPDLSAQWRLAEQARPTMLGLSPSFVLASPQGGRRAPAARPLVDPHARGRRLAAAARRVRLAPRTVRLERVAQRRQRRHRHLHRDRPGQPAPPGLRRRDVGTLPGRRCAGVFDRRANRWWASSASS